MAEYPWYEHISKGNDGLLQGDMIRECPIIEPSSKIELGSVQANIRSFDVVILSQSCDLENKKVQLVLVSPIWSLSVIKDDPQFKTPKEYTRFIEKVQKGEQPNYHLLSKCVLSSFQSEAVLVDFRNVYAVHFDVLTELARNESRIRLLPPYREHLSQAFARFFMRVGLPSVVEF